MTEISPSFQEVAELAARLSPEDRLRLIAWFGEKSGESSGGSVAAGAPAGSATAILHAVRQPPHLSAEDVDELEEAIAAGRLQVRWRGPFDGEDGR